jgi:2-polyprenyl-6-methoxyphenol hydroxylase-like FAD-dependent oxidoreductase
MKVTIIGAGIGGLTTAIALKKRGIEVEIFEAATEFKKVGAGIIIAINSMQLYKRLGMAEKILEAGNKLGRFEITNANLKVLTTSDTDYFGKNYNLSNVAIHRADLHEVLLSELAEIPIYMGKILKNLAQHSGFINLEFEDGTKHQTNLLIGGDGVNSVVRKSIFPESQVRWAKQLCWRGITTFDLGTNYKHGAREAWGHNERFGIVPIGENKVYWYACAGYKESSKKEFGGQSIESVFKKFNPLVKDIINSTPKNSIITAELGDLDPIPMWYQGNVCLVGDAAHATTPNMGQGANQAIESAWVLANCLAHEKGPSKAFAEYQQIRQKKANMVVHTSWKVGKLAHVSSPILAKLRNGFLYIIPSFLGRKQLKGLFDLGY